MISDILKRWVRRSWKVEALAYLIHNNLLPWINYSGANLEARSEPEAAEYVKTIAKRYRDAARVAGKTLLGARILEIGPGETLGAAVCLVAWGAAEVVCVDRFDCLGELHERGTFYRTLLNSFTVAEAERVERLCPWVRASPVSHQISGTITLLSGYSLENCNSGIGERRFDAIVSNAVLEHLRDVDGGIAAVVPLLTPTGWMFHEIDFRSHGRFDARSPLWFLTVPDLLWRLMTSRVGAPNRVRPTHFRRLFRRHGFVVREDVVEAFPREEIEAVLPRIVHDTRTADDLRGAVIRFTLTREESVR